MDRIKQFIKWTASLPFVARIILYIALCIIACIASMSLSACGTPKTIATVQNVNPNSTVTVSMTVSNSNTSSPSITTDIEDSLKIPSSR